MSGEVERANNRAVGAAVLTAALATAAGAAIGAAGDGDVYRTRRGVYREDSASAGEGAAVGAALGALGGAAIGAGASGEAQDPIQRRYNIAYSQCMYSRGNQVPGYRDDARRTPPPPPPEY